MSTKKCANCQYFRQHYGLDSQRLFRLYCGHCTFVRPKRKRPDDAACENYIAAAADTESFVSREYLNKKLLDHVFNLELLPEIIDDHPPHKEAKPEKEA